MSSRNTSKSECTPFEDKEHFDQSLFDSIKPPKKPPSPKKVLIISSIPVLLLVIMGGGIVGFLCFEPISLIFYALFKSKETNWKRTMAQLDQYKIDQYNKLKKEQNRNEEKKRIIRKFEEAPIRYECRPSRYSGIIARYSVYPETHPRVEILLREEEYIVIPFQEILGSQVLEDAEVRGSVGRAVVGGAIAGGAGAIVGASTTKKSVTSFVVRINSNNLRSPSYDIPLINGKAEVTSSFYKAVVAFANDVQSSIQSIVANQQAETVTAKPETIEKPPPKQEAEPNPKFSQPLSKSPPIDTFSQEKESTPKERSTHQSELEQKPHSAARKSDLSPQKLRLVSQKKEAEQKPSGEKSYAVASKVGVADEIRKFKELLDCGAITQEEFETAKRQLLNF